MPFYQLPSEQKQQIPGVKLQERPFFHSSKHKTIVRIFQRRRAGNCRLKKLHQQVHVNHPADKDDSSALVMEATLTLQPLHTLVR